MFYVSKTLVVVYPKAIKQQYQLLETR